MRSFAEAAGAVTVLAEAQGELAGSGIAQLEKQIAYVVTLDVAPGWRRRGLARRLMAELESKAHAAGATAMTLHVFTGNAGQSSSMSPSATAAWAGRKPSTDAAWTRSSTASGSRASSRRYS